MSRATMVVLPRELVPHWLCQIRQHLQPGSLHVAVLQGNNAGGCTLTTFGADTSGELEAAVDGEADNESEAAAVSPPKVSCGVLVSIRVLPTMDSSACV